MLKRDLLKLIEKATDEQDIDDLVVGSDLAKSLQASGLTLEAFKEKMKNDAVFKAYIESENDKHHNKALDTWKKNNLEKELEPFIQAKYPDLVTDPVQKQLLEVQKELATAKAEAAREKILTQAMAYAGEKKLPTSFVEKFLGEDLDTTKANLDVLATDWAKGLEVMVNEKMKSSSYVPGNGADGNPVSIGASIAAQNNKSSSAPSNPWGDK